MHTLMKIFFVTILSILLTSIALSWGNATHMYLVKNLSTKPGPANFNEMYGAVLPDAFNFMFDANGQYLYLQTHENFQPLYSLAWNPHLKEVAFGDVSHNQLFGADWTAHIDGYSFGGGYAVEKGISLAPALVPTLITIMTDAGLDQPTAEAIAQGIAPALGHDLSETAVDLLVKQNLDRMIGKQMYLAAHTRHKDVPRLLSAAYAEGLGTFAGISTQEASAMIIGAETGFREYIMQYGQAFMLPESQTIAVLAAQTAPVAQMYIEAATGNAVTVTVTPEQVAYFILAAMTNVQPDYAEELAMTLAHLKEVMSPYRVTPFASLNSEPAQAQGLVGAVPVKFSLSQNYPNPFNPATTISYSLPVAAHVTLKVYNMLGQEVVTLIDADLSAGEYATPWNAAEVPSGAYIYKITADDFSATKHLMLVK